MNSGTQSCDSVSACFHKCSWLPGLLTRLTLGWVFVTSGWGKLHHLGRVTEFFTSLGIPAPHLQAPFVAGVELVAGFLVLVGLFTRYASFPLALIMVVATLTAKKNDIGTFTDIFGINDYLYILLFIWLMFEGAGRISLDYLVCKKHKTI